MATTIEELSAKDKMALFQQMVQTGTVVAGVAPGRMGRAMTTVEVAGAVTLEDLAEERIDVAAAH